MKYFAKYDFSKMDNQEEEVKLEEAPMVEEKLDEEPQLESSMAGTGTALNFNTCIQEDDLIIPSRQSLIRQEQELEEQMAQLQIQHQNQAESLDNEGLEEEKVEIPPQISFKEALSPPEEIMPMQKQQSSESDDGTMIELQMNDFSIQVTKAEIVTPPSEGGSYFSYISPISNSYAIFTIETKSRLPMYDGVNRLHKVLRRFSDFEYLLKQL